MEQIEEANSEITKYGKKRGYADETMHLMKMKLGV